MVNLRDHSSRDPFPMSSTVRWDRPLLQTLVATHMRLLPCISWKTPKRNLCHLDWTFNIRTLNWTFTYGIGLEEENKFKFQFWTCHVRTIKPTLWVYSNGLWSYRKLSVLKNNIPSIPNIFSPPPPSFPPVKKRHVVWHCLNTKKQHCDNMIDAFLETKHIRAEISSPPTNRSYVMCIPRTQMTLVLIGKGLVLGGWPSNIEVIWVLGNSL